MTLKDLAKDMGAYQERMRRKSKARFRRYLETQAKKYDLEYQVSKSKLAKNVIIGNIETADYVIGAHYDTPPRLPAFIANNILLTNIALMVIIPTMIIFSLFVYNIALPAMIIYFLTLLYLLGFLSIPNKKNYNDNTSGVLVLLYLMSILRNEKVAYVFFDNEEKGLFGSFSFLSFLNKKNLKPRRKKFIVLDCVGRGELIRFTYFKDNNLPRELHKVADNGARGEYRFEVKKSSLLEMSDHVAFMHHSHVGVFAYEEKGKKHRIRNIHSAKDKYFNIENIAIIARVIYNYISKEEYYE